MKPETSEKDFLSYTGNKIPRIIRLAWSVLIAFCVYYMTKFSWPDLKLWLDKLK